MQSAEQRSIEAMQRCHARWLEPYEPKAVCANCGDRIPAGGMAYKHEPVCSKTCWDELLERDR